MAARLATGTETQSARLRRLSVVFAVELRLKIVTELYMRPMSPKQFYEEFGGGSLSRVGKNFKRLWEHGWLRLVRKEGPGGARHGGIESFYRSTELAFFDADTWALMPYSIRVASSWNIFKQIAPRLLEAMEAASLPTAPARDLTSTALSVDQIGWERVIEAVDAQFVGLFEEQEDARLRVAQSEEKLIRADVFMIAFESPGPAEKRVAVSLVESEKDPMIPFLERLAPILADELCMQIVTELNNRSMSATQFHRELGGASVGGIGRRFRRLETSGWLKRVEKKTGGPRRGAKEQFYQATKPAISDDCSWADPPEPPKDKASWIAFQHLSQSVRDAMRAGTFDVRVDRYVTWSLISLDAQGWEGVTAGIEDLYTFLFEEQKRAKLRMDRTGEKPITMTIGLGAYAALKDSTKAA